MNVNRVSWMEALPHGRIFRGFIITLGVLAFSLLLLIPWLTSIAAQPSESNIMVSNLDDRENAFVDLPKEIIFPSDINSFADLPDLSVWKALAPLASVAPSDYDYGVTKYPNPPTFTGSQISARRYYSRF